MHFENKLKIKSKKILKNFYLITLNVSLESNFSIFFFGFGKSILSIRTTAIIINKKIKLNLIKNFPIELKVLALVFL